MYSGAVTSGLVCVSQWLLGRCLDVVHLQVGSRISGTLLLALQSLARRCSSIVLRRVYPSPEAPGEAVFRTALSVRATVPSASLQRKTVSSFLFLTGTLHPGEA